MTEQFIEIYRVIAINIMGITLFLFATIFGPDSNNKKKKAS